jgi:hypothetical protein
MKEKIVRVCPLHDEPEAQLLCGILEKQNIPYTLKPMADAAYNGIYQAQACWGYIEAPAPYADSIMAIVEDIRSTKKKRKAASSSERSIIRERRFWMIFGTVVIAIIITAAIFGMQNRQLKYENNLYRKQRFITWKWIESDRVMQGLSTATNAIRYEYSDKNKNRAYEQMVVHSPDRKIIVTFYDENENGLSERTDVRTSDGTMVSREIESDENDLREGMEFYYEIDTRLRLEDINNDGRFDIIKVIKDGKPKKEMNIMKEFLR